MNERKIAFIYCYNDERKLNESTLYIQSLNIPIGYEIEIIPVRGASSMTAGYNFAISQTDAKYKVFLHQDVFIINKNFIKSILEIFQQDKNIGLIGMVGDNTLPAISNSWKVKGNSGKVYSCHNGQLELLAFDEVESQYENVHSVGSFLMVTQYDIPWREDLFDGWCFYDTSQSLEYIRKGFEVVVPYQTTPWCIHDCKYNHVSQDYGKYREILIDEYSDFLEKLASKTATVDLFDFDKVRAEKIVNTNNEQFISLVNNAQIYLYQEDFEQASKWAYEAAKFASENHPGLYVSDDLEEILIECAKNLPDSIGEANIPTIKEMKKRRVLHVLSEGYETGGHTRLVKNWVAKDKESIHSLITTWQLKTTPEWLLNEINLSGGWVYSLEENNDFIVRASELREIAYEWADIVVLHVHMFDPIPIMAFGVEGGPPVLFMNHGDHVFWLGKTIIDHLISFRESGLELSLNRRGISNNSILPLPLTFPKFQRKDKNEIREKLGISKEKIILLTIATPYKFNSFGEIHYIDIIKRVLNIHEDVIAIVIGPNNTGEWEKAYSETNGRILPLGMRQDIEEFYCISDIYVDSYMFGSVTSALDGGLNGLPIVALENKHNKTLSFNDISYSHFNKEFNSIEDYLYYVNKLIIDKDFRECDGRQLSHKIKEDHIDNWTEKLNEIYIIVENQVHKVYLNNEIEDKKNNEDLFLALFQNKKTNKNEINTTSTPLISESEEGLLKNKIDFIIKYYNDDKFTLAKLVGNSLIKDNHKNTILLVILAEISNKDNKSWLANKYLEEAIKLSPEDSNIILSYLKLNLMEDIKGLVYDQYKHNKNNESYLTYYNHIKNHDYFNLLFKNGEYENALSFYKSINNEDCHLYKVTNVKEFCERNNYCYITLEDDRNREVYIPDYYGSNEAVRVQRVLSSEIYLAELKDVNIIGENSVILTNEYCLYDMATRDINNKYDLRFSTLRNIDEKYAIVEFINSKEVIEEAISLVGFAPFNYYHFSIELMSRLQYVDQFEKFRNIPLLIDEAALNIQQYQDLLDILNTYNHPVIPIKKSYMYKVKKLIYPSSNTWMPINITEGEQYKVEDFVISNSAVGYVRNSVLKENNIKGHRKIFVSRKNTSNSRLINEEMVIELFKQYDFEIVFPEELTFQEQVEIFSQAEYVAGATGAAFTNIIYCPKNVNIICIIPKEYNFYLYSSIGNLLGFNLLYLNAEIITKKKLISSEHFKVDLIDCVESLNSLGLTKKLGSDEDLLQQVAEEINNFREIINPYDADCDDTNTICNRLNFLLRNKLLIEDINEFFEIKSVLNNIQNVFKELRTISDFNEWNYVTNIVIEEICKIIIEEIEKLGDFVELNKIQNIIARLKTKFRKKIKVVFLVQLPSIWPSTESVWKSFSDDARCEVQIVQLPFYHHNYDQKQNESIGDYLDKKNISYKYWYDVNLENEKPDVVFFQNPYDSTRPAKYSFGEISKFVKRTVYIHYCLDILGGEVLDYHFKLPACTDSWKVFVRSERYKGMFKNYCPKGDDHIVVTGHPKMDILYNLDKINVEKELEEWIGNRKVILWNPHHMIKENEWSTFMEWQELILNKFKERNDIFLIIRPHPLLLGNLEREFGGTEFVNLFLENVKSLENVMLDLSDDYKQAFKVSDALISDASSLLLEYLPTRNPIMYLPKINGGGLNDDGDIVDYYYNGIEEKDIRDFIDLISNDQDSMYQKRISQINNYLYSFDGKAGYRIKEHIISSLLDEDI